MPLLTPELLENFYFYYYTDSRTVQRGTQYQREGRVEVLSFDNERAVLEVEGENGDYEVQIWAKTKNQLSLSCDCPHAERTQVCKHMVAAVLELKQYFKDTNITSNWQYQLAQSLAEPVRGASASSKPARYAAMFSLHPQEYYNQTTYALLPYVVRASDWDELRRQSAATPAELNDLFSSNREWARYIQPAHNQVNPEGCVNLASEGVIFLNFLIQARRMQGEFTNFGSYLPMLARLDALVFSGRSRDLGKRLQILTDPVTVQAALTRDGADLQLAAGFELNGKLINPGKDKLSVISKNPYWVMLGHFLAPLANPKGAPVLESLPLTIPANEEETFRSRYFNQLASRLPIHGDVIEWQTYAGEPLPRLYLRDDQGTLRADLRYGYGDYEVAPEANPSPEVVIDIPGTWQMVRLVRQPEREAEFYGLLTDSAYRLKRASREFPYGTFELRARAHPFDFLLHSIPLLTKAGFEIYGEENLKSGRINRHTPSLRVKVRSGIDWFDLEAEVAYGDQHVALKEIQKALKRGEKYVKLADGSIGQIPEAWLEKYKHLWELADDTGEGLRLHDMHLPLVDTLLADAEQVQIPADLKERRQRLQSFEQITPQPLPAGFDGELRPYQRHGFDWLHFLREYRFGGILADDMGLGKTIQVLAYLQSLREQGKPEAASLLVVPKSLLANWQREAARFTPQLTFLEYTGASRQKDTKIFNDYDVIITTYGTMLRDIELLRSYRFYYAILDESQAIKNAVSQSAKAARLINAQFRLSMTGTPVENNTFELWSQFAYTNPGLLGSQTYFKSEFAAPIENSQDAAAADLLKKLIYPFILRRTKEQVAPELPPRTERVLYTDMLPHQRKLYTQTRERYRAELLGLIESQGIEGSQMKILEGLLRLRQVAIHPGLVEPAFKGEAPKFELLLETLETLQAEKHKALIFSQFVQTLSLLRAELDQRGVSYAYLDGQTRDRQEQVDRFQTDPRLPFFLISLKAGGVGLNLTAADYVIHLDPWWNPAVEMQASDRAHRIGQDKPVFVYKLITRDTVEEKILQLQEQKRSLVENLISSETSFFKSLTKDDVKVLFS